MSNHVCINVCWTLQIEKTKTKLSSNASEFNKNIIWRCVHIRGIQGDSAEQYYKNILDK